MKEAEQKKLGTLLLPLVNVVLLALYSFYHIGLDKFYCPSADDFSGLFYASQGLPGLSYAWRFYLNWEGPFLSMVIQGLLMKSVTIGVPPYVGLLVVKLSLLLSSYVLLMALSSTLKIGWEKHEGLFVALIMNICLYEISTEPSQIWHWLIGTTYLTPLIFLQIGVAFLIRGQFLLALLPFAFVMQSRATYAVLFFGLIALIGTASIIFQWENRKKWLSFSFGSLFFLVVYLAAPGNYVRMVEHGNSVAFMATQFKIGLHNLFVSYNLAKLDSIAAGLLASLPVIAHKGDRIRPKETWQWFAPAALYGGFAVAHEVLFVYVTGYREWPRVLSLHSFLFLCMAFVYGVWLLSMISNRIHKGAIPLSVLGIFCLGQMLFSSYAAEVKSAKQLKGNYDERMQAVLSYQGMDTFLVAPLHYNGVLYFEDFSKDPDNWINKDFTKAYDLQFKIALEDNADEE